MQTLPADSAVVNHAFPERGWELVSLAEFGDPEPIVVGTAIPRLFSDAFSSKLRYPKVLLARRGAMDVLLKPAPRSSKWAGSVRVFVEVDYKEYDYAGSIGTDGILRPNSAMTTDIVKLLRRFSDDPIAVAAECGQVSGNCSFCRSALSDPRSTAHGYGETCARAWRLPWRANRGLLKITGGLYPYVWVGAGGAARVS
jgi:hypothetical protein